MHDESGKMNRVFLTIILLAGIGLIGGIVFYFMLPTFYRFLSEEKPVNSEILVVQGWLFPFMYDEVASRVLCDSVSTIIVTGSQKTVAIGVSQLVSRNVCPEKIVASPYSDSCKGIHTFREAYGLRSYLLNNRPDILDLNVFTSAAHGKKTLVIFKKVLGKNIRVGIMTCKKNGFDETRLLHSRGGIRVTVEYLLGYLYGLVWPVNNQAE